jgi:hypothetical protein
MQDLWKQWVAKLWLLHEPQPHKVIRTTGEPATPASVIYVHARGSSSLGGDAGEPTTSASVCEALTRLRRRHAHDSMVGKQDLVGSDDMPATLASLRAGSLTWGQKILKGCFGVRRTLYFYFVGCTLCMCIFFSDTSQHIKDYFTLL